MDIPHTHQFTANYHVSQDAILLWCLTCRYEDTILRTDPRYKAALAFMRGQQ